MHPAQNFIFRSECDGGSEFSVNVKISSQDGNLGASDVVLSYDPSVIEFVSGNNASGVQVPSA